MNRSEVLLGTIQVVASDLDGTLLDPSHVPGPGTTEAIARFQQAGGIFAVCTGRDKGSARTVLQPNGIDVDKLPGVFMNGTVVQGLNGEVLQSATIPRKIIDDVVAWGRANRADASILFVEGDTHYVMDPEDEYALFMHKHLLDPEPLQVKGGWTSSEPQLPAVVNLMRVICSPDKMDLVKPQVQQLVAGGASCAQSLPTTIDIMAADTNKATGLSVLLKSIGLSEAHAAAVGDSENDIEMLQYVKVACAMGNAKPKTKAVAHFILPRNDDAVPGVVSLLDQITAALKAGKEAPKAAEVAGPKVKVAVFGGGGWGTPVARMAACSLLHHPKFERELCWWINDESVNGMPLSEYINTHRENVKYAPGTRLPPNLRAMSSALEAARGADILIFAERQDVMQRLLIEIAGNVKSTAVACIMSKDMVEITCTGAGLRFGSQVVAEALGIPTSVVMGGTSRDEVMEGHFAEATLGCESSETTALLLDLFNKPNFNVQAVRSMLAVELFAVLRNIVALAAGISDGVGYGSNTKAALVRLGAVEIQKFAMHFYPQQVVHTALNEACGWTDLITCSFGKSRNRSWGCSFAKDPSRSDEAISLDSTVGGKVPTGIRTVKDIAAFIRQRRVEVEFPFITKIDRIVSRIDAPSTLTDMTKPASRLSDALKVSIMGSGNWGTAIARIIAENVLNLPDFHQTVKIWVHEEMVDGRKLTEIMNTEHENVKYLKGFRLPDNLIAEPDAIECVKSADILLFVLPHQFLDRLLDTIADHVRPDTMALSMIKGHMKVLDGGKSLKTGSQVISERLSLSGCAVLNGANVADDVAKGNFAEATLGCENERNAALLARLVNTKNFSVRTTSDVFGVELFGGLKNIVALGAGFADGLGLASNTKAAILRRGLLEMSTLIKNIFPSSNAETLRESCGIADLLTSCYSGRNWRCAKAYAEDPSQTWEDIEARLLNGQKLQGPSCCLEVQELINHRNLVDQLPLLTAIHGAVTKRITPTDVFTTNGFLA